MLRPSVSVASAQGGYLAGKECGKAHFKWSHQCVTATEVGGGGAGEGRGFNDSL